MSVNIVGFQGRKASVYPTLSRVNALRDSSLFIKSGPMLFMVMLSLLGCERHRDQINSKETANAQLIKSEKIGAAVPFWCRCDSTLGITSGQDNGKELVVQEPRDRLPDSCRRKQIGQVFQVSYTRLVEWDGYTFFVHGHITESGKE